MEKDIQCVEFMNVVDFKAEGYGFNYLKYRSMVPVPTNGLMMWLNNSLLLQNIINASLDDLDESVLVAESEDVEDLT